MLTGLNSNTANELQLGAGLISTTKIDSSTIIDDEWKKNNVVCATTGGISIALVPEYYTPNIDGNSDNVKGTGKIITRWTATASTTTMETEINMLKTALGVADVSGSKITARHIIKDTDYQDIYIVAEKANGDLIQVTLKNAINTNGLTLATTDKGQGSIGLTLSANYDVKKLDEVPFEIEVLQPATNIGE